MASAGRSLPELASDFVSYKRSLGYAYGRGIPSSVTRLAEFLEGQRGCGGPLVSKEAVVKFIAPRPGEKTSTRVNRASLLRQFCLYLRRMGHEDVYVLPKQLFPKEGKDFVPRVFSHEEILLLARCFDGMEPTLKAPTCHLVFPALFRVFYGCGLRLGEATGLRREEVDLDAGLFVIRRAKGGRERLVPLSSSLKDYLAGYEGEMEEAGGFEGAELFFPNAAGGRLSQQGVLYRFQELYAMAGIFNENGRPPRVHDLRTTFAVHALEQGERDGIPSSVLLPLLATYMGHADVKSTEYYLRLSESLGNVAIDKFDLWADSLENLGEANEG